MRSSRPEQAVCTFVHQSQPSLLPPPRHPRPRSFGFQALEVRYSPSQGYCPSPNLRIVLGSNH